MGNSNVVTSEMISQLKYLDMVIKESLRIYPSVPGIGRVLSEDVVIDGVTIPKGTDITIQIHVMHNSKRFWEDPEVFDPERWSLENSKDKDPFLYIPFSAGNRNCIGKSLLNLCQMN